MSALALFLSIFLNIVAGHAPAVTSSAHAPIVAPMDTQGYLPGG